MNRSPARALAGAMLALVAVAATFSAPTPATAAPAAAVAKAPAKPKVGSCHAVTMREANAVSDADAPVSCRKKHTTVTIKVLPVSKRVAGDPNLSFTAGLKGCSKALASYLRGTPVARKMSAYTTIWFSPTAAQVEQGAAWIRCDVALYGGGRELAPLPTTGKPTLGSLPHPDRIASCLKVTRRAFAVTTCSRAHNYRAKGTIKLSGRYPGDDRLSRIAAQRCPRIAGSRTYYATWPGEQSWKLAGDRLMVCFRKTNR